MKYILDICLFKFSREGLGEAYDREIAFASALETFGGGHNDPISVAFGGTFCLFSVWVVFQLGNFQTCVNLFPLNAPKLVIIKT